MRRRIVSAALGFLFLATASAHSQQIDALIVGDTDDASIGHGVVNNVHRVEAFLKRVQGDAKIPVSSAEVLADNFSCSGINIAVSKLAPSQQDTVIFYYSGHGFRRDETQTKFPEFDCSRKINDGTAVFSSIVKAIQQKHPRLIIAIADTCNILMSPQGFAAYVVAAPVSDEGQGMRHLLLEYSGTIEISGAIPGEYSYYYVNDPINGGFFTEQFLGDVGASLEQDGPKAQWQKILLSAGQPIPIPVDPPVIQHPQAEVVDLVEKVH